MLKKVVALIVTLTCAVTAIAANRSNGLAIKQSASEVTLASIRRSDAADRDAQGRLKKLPQAFSKIILGELIIVSQQRGIP